MYDQTTDVLESDTLARPETSNPSAALAAPRLNHPIEPACTAAETLLTAFHLQDEREARLLDGDAAGARQAALRATERMADAFAFEFPDVPTARAHAAGIRFMEALFLQDEIENRRALADLARRDGLDGVRLVSGAVDIPTDEVLADPRWESVVMYLRDTCEHVGVDTEYAEVQTRFWKMHGQGLDWADLAFDAHRIKLRAMLPDPDPGTLDTLAGHFVTGVAQHDRWGRGDTRGAVQEVLEPVVEYYRVIFSRRRSVGASPQSPSPSI